VVVEQEHADLGGGSGHVPIVPSERPGRAGTMVPIAPGWTYG
jgi:hypothetical protein